MEKFIVEASEDTPYICIDYDSGIIEFQGKSLPEDSVAFFTPVDAAIRNYIENPKPKTIINLRLEYLNSSSQKKMVLLISLFEILTINGLEVDVNWFFKEEDEDMQDEGFEFSRMISLPLNILPDA